MTMRPLGILICSRRLQFSNAPTPILFTLFKEDICVSAKELASLYRERYCGPIGSYADDISENGFISGAGLSGKDSMQISVLGNDDRILLVARYDNLGKGASGAAVENLNIVLGLDKTLGLEL